MIFLIFLLNIIFLFDSKILTFLLACESLSKGDVQSFFSKRYDFARLVKKKQRKHALERTEKHRTNKHFKVFVVNKR